MKLICIVFLSFFCHLLAAQTYYPLHPSVGDTIDQYEKLDYSLFPSVDNRSFEFAMILFENDNYFLDLTDTTGNRSKQSVSKEELIEAQQNIEKINDYFRLMAAEKSKEEQKQSEILRDNKKIPIKLDGPMTDQMRKEARMNVRLKDDARRRTEFEQGLRQNSLHIEFK